MLFRSLFFLLIQTKSLFAQEISIFIIDETNANQAESMIYQDEAFLLFKKLHKRYAAHYPVEMFTSLFNNQIESVKDGQSKLFLALSNNKVIGNIFTVYNENHKMTQLRFLGFDTNLTQEECTKIFEKVIKNIKHNDISTSKGICCVTNKIIVNYLWLFEKLNLLKNPSLFGADKYNPENYDWYSRNY